MLGRVLEQRLQLDPLGFRWSRSRHGTRAGWTNIKVGRRHGGTRVLMLVARLDVRIVSEDGELLRTLTLDPAKSYQPLCTR